MPSFYLGCEQVTSKDKYNDSDIYIFIHDHKIWNIYSPVNKISVFIYYLTNFPLKNISRVSNAPPRSFLLQRRSELSSLSSEDLAPDRDMKSRKLSLESKNKQIAIHTAANWCESDNQWTSNHKLHKPTIFHTITIWLLYFPFENITIYELFIWFQNSLRHNSYPPWLIRVNVIRDFNTFSVFFFLILK